MALATRISSRQRQRPLRPRKSPSQARSHTTVDALLEATAQLLEEQGYARLSTNHVARRAGVSIGSLYQYFPNKEALCHALAERHFQRYAARYREQLDRSAQLPVEVQVRHLVRLNFEMARTDPSLAKSLYVELARIGGFDPVQRMREEIEQALAERIRALPGTLRPKQPGMTAFIVTVACSQIIGDTVLRKPEWLQNEAFVEQVCELVLGYYQRLGWLG
jgi:AcrR family transcriptional regulator